MPFISDNMRSKYIENEYIYIYINDAINEVINAIIRRIIA